MEKGFFNWDGNVKMVGGALVILLIAGAFVTAILFLRAPAAPATTNNAIYAPVQQEPAEVVEEYTSLVGSASLNSQLTIGDSYFIQFTQDQYMNLHVFYGSDLANNQLIDQPVFVGQEIKIEGYPPQYRIMVYADHIEVYTKP